MNASRDVSLLFMMLFAWRNSLVSGAKIISGQELSARYFLFLDVLALGGEGKNC